MQVKGENAKGNNKTSVNAGDENGNKEAIELKNNASEGENAKGNNKTSVNAGDENGNKEAIELKNNASEGENAKGNNKTSVNAGDENGNKEAIELKNNASEGENAKGNNTTSVNAGDGNVNEETFERENNASDEKKEYAKEMDIVQDSKESSAEDNEFEGLHSVVDSIVERIDIDNCTEKKSVFSADENNDNDEFDEGDDVIPFPLTQNVTSKRQEMAITYLFSEQENDNLDFDPVLIGPRPVGGAMRYCPNTEAISDADGSGDDAVKCHYHYENEKGKTDDSTQNQQTGGLMQNKETEADKCSENKADETGDSTQNQKTGDLMQNKETEADKCSENKADETGDSTQNQKTGDLMQNKETEADESSENKADETGDSTQNQKTGDLMQNKEMEADESSENKADETGDSTQNQKTGDLMQNKETEADESSENKAKDETGDSTQNQETAALMETEEEKAKDEKDNTENKGKGKSGNGEEKLPGLDLRIPGHGVQIPGFGPIPGIRIPGQRTCSKGPSREEREKRLKQMLCSDTDDEPHTMEKELESYLTNTPNNNVSKGKKETSPTSNVAVADEDEISQIDENDSASKKIEIK